MEIIIAGPGDAAEIAAMHSRSWQQHYVGIYSDAYLAGPIKQERLELWTERMTNPAVNQRVLKAIENDQLIGFCCLYLDDDSEFGSLIDNLHVTTQQHRSGIGRQLLQHAAAIIGKESSKQQMYLWVYEANSNARKAYQRLGGMELPPELKNNPDGSQAFAHRVSWPDLSAFAL